MKILVIGAHGRVGQRIVNQLNDNGDDVLAGLRDEKQFNTFTGAHITPTLLDIQQITVADLTQLMTGADAVVFSAGAGGGGYDRTMLIDLDGAKTVSRDDVAKAAVVALHDDKTIKQIISFTGGDTAIETAVDSLS